jgi:dihydrofolate reductase
MILSCIAAVADNGVIGLRGALPWRAPADLKYFRQVTWGHTILMGRTTYETLERPLPGRTTIVLTSRRAFAAADGVIVERTLDDALRRCAHEDEVFVVGGAVLYRAALPRADKLYLTRVHLAPDGDTFFPEIDPLDWRVASEGVREPDDRTPVRLTFQVLERLERRSDVAGRAET